MSLRRIDKTIGLSVLVVAVLLALMPLFIGSPPESVPGSVGASDATGRRALFLLVQELGFGPEAWVQPPGRLPSGGNLVWLASAPKSWSERQPVPVPLHLPGSSRDESSRDESAPHAPARPGADPKSPNPEPEPNEVDRANEKDEKDSEGEHKSKPDMQSDARDTMPSQLRVQSLSHYRRFLEEGGTLVMRYDERGQRFLCHDLELDDFCTGDAPGGLALDSESTAGPRRVHTESGEELEVDWPKGATFRDLASNGSMRALWTAARSDGERDEVLAVVAPVGGGRLVLLGDDAFLDNAKLREKDHVLLAVRLAELLRPGGRLLFDEFALGLWQPETAASLATSPRLVLITLHIALLVFLFVWAKSWAKTFPRDPPALARVSPLSRARARAALYERARRIDVLAGMLRRGSARRWLRLVGLRPSRPDPHPSEPRAAFDPRPPFELRAGENVSADRSMTPPLMSSPRPSAPDAFDADIARIAAHVGPGIGRPGMSERWRAIVARRPVRTIDDLEALARDLERIEADIEAGERRAKLRAG